MMVFRSYFSCLAGIHANQGGKNFQFPICFNAGFQEPATTAAVL